MNIQSKLILLIWWLIAPKEYREYWRKKQFTDAIHRLKNHVGTSEDLRIVLRESKNG